MVELSSVASNCGTFLEEENAVTEVIVYLDDNSTWTQAEIPWQNLTCINYAFGKINGTTIVPELKKIGLINALKRAHPELRTCLSIGGWSTEGFSDGVATAASRQALVSSIVAYCQRYDFDGVDLDWEYPGMDLAGIKARPDDAAHFLAFVQALRQALDQAENGHSRRYWLTAAIGAAKPLLDTMSPDADYHYLGYLDFVNVMTYDLRGSWTHEASHHTNLFGYGDTAFTALSADQAVANLLAKGISPAKIVIGAASYSRDWFGFPATAISGLGAQAETLGTGTTDYNQLRQLIASHPEFRHWDEQAQAPYYFDGQRFSSFDDPQSIKAKANYIKQHQLRGIMFWEYSLDHSGELLATAAAELR